MSIIQTRRSISVRGDTYRALLADCQARGVNVSHHLEQLIAADRSARGLTSAARQVPGTGSAQRPEPAAGRPPAPPLAPPPAEVSEHRRLTGTAPGPAWGYNRFPRAGAVARKASAVPPIPEGRDGVPMREVRTKVPVSKGEVRW